MNNKDPQTKAELLQLVQNGRIQLTTLINQIPKERMEEKGVESDWSIKDILAHITAWETKMSTSFAHILVSNDPPEWPTTPKAVDDLNAKFYADNRDKSLTQVLAEFETSYPNAVAATEALSADDLFNPDRFAWREGNPLWWTVAGNTFGHYTDHIPNIQTWLNNK